MHVYRLYGLSLRSQWPLPCPESKGTGLGRVELRRGPAALFRRGQAQAPSAPGRWFARARLADDSLYLRWSGLFEFLIAPDGRRIVGRPLNGVSSEAFHTYLVSQVLSFALLRQGIEPLHATTMVVEGKAVAFLGDCGTGKSTLGAAFLRAGHRLVTDDLLVLEERDKSFFAQPGPPRVKLFPAVARKLLGGSAIGVPMNPGTSKQVIPLGPEQVAGEAVPLRALYVLTPSRSSAGPNRVALRSLSSRQAFLSLVANTFNPVVTEASRLGRQFEAAARLAAGVPVKSLSYPRRLARLPAVVEAVERDLGS